LREPVDGKLDHLALPSDRRERVVGAGNDDLFLDGGAGGSEEVFGVREWQVGIVLRMDDQDRLGEVRD